MSNNYNNNRKKRSARRFWQFAAAILASVLLSVFVVGAFGGLENPFEKDRNPDNLIVVNDSYIKSQDTNRGVEIDVKDDGTIKLSGKATSDHNVTITTMTLDAGTYTISGLEDPDVNNFYMYVSYGAGQAIAGTESATFVLDTATSVSVILTWKNEYNFSKLFTENKVQPVLVKGETAGSFYVD